MIIYEGESVLDGVPIVAIATGLELASSNPKTGKMVQVFILLQDMAPHYATQTGQDISVCGNCPHRHFNNGACYVDPSKAAFSVWKKYKNGGYADIDLDAFQGRAIRWGAYGDPAAIPFNALLPVLDVSDLDGSTGYTHQLNHINFDYRIGMFCQVSADTPKQAIKAQSMGYKTFRVVGDINALLPEETVCLNTTIELTCAECKLCNGVSENIVIAMHGARASKSKTHDIIARG